MIVFFRHYFEWPCNYTNDQTWVAPLDRVLCHIFLSWPFHYFRCRSNAICSTLLIFWLCKQVLVRGAVVPSCFHVQSHNKVKLLVVHERSSQHMYTRWLKKASGNRNELGKWCVYSMSFQSCKESQLPHEICNFFQRCILAGYVNLKKLELMCFLWPDGGTLSRKTSKVPLKAQYNSCFFFVLIWFDFYSIVHCFWDRCFDWLKFHIKLQSRWHNQQNCCLQVPVSSVCWKGYVLFWGTVSVRQ